MYSLLKENLIKRNLLQFSDIDRGIRAFGSNFLIKGKFRIEDAIIASARVAYLASKLLVGDFSSIYYYAEEGIKSLTIENSDWNFLNKLKKQADKSSFYYWYNTVQLLTKSKKIVK